MSERVVGIILAGVVLLFMLPVTGCRTTPDEVLLSFPETIEGRFAIVPHPSHELYIVGKDNLDAPQVAFSTSDYYGILSSPVWSPDGTRIAFVAEEDSFSRIVVFNPSGEKTKEYELRLENVRGETVDGRIVSRTATCRGNEPVWAWDGNRVVLGCVLRFLYQASDRGMAPRVVNASRLFIWDTQTQETAEIVLPATVTGVPRGNIAWQSSVQDDRLVIVVSRRDPESQESLGDQVWLLDTESGTHNVLVDCETLDSLYCHVSSWGNYVDIYGYEEDIRVLDLKSGAVVLLDLPEGIAGVGAWSPDGTRMAFGGANLFLLDLNSGEVEILQTGYSRRPLLGRAEWVGFSSPQWLDNNHIAVVRRRAQSIPGSWEHRESDSIYLQVVRVEDGAVWTVFEREYEYEGGLEFDWTPVSD